MKDWPVEELAQLFASQFKTKAHFMKDFYKLTTNPSPSERQKAIIAPLNKFLALLIQLKCDTTVERLQPILTGLNRAGRANVAFCGVQYLLLHFFKLNVMCPPLRTFFVDYALVTLEQTVQCLKVQCPFVKLGKLFNQDFVSQCFTTEEYKEWRDLIDSAKPRDYIVTTDYIPTSYYHVHTAPNLQPADPIARELKDS